MSQQLVSFDYSGIDLEIAALMRQTAQHVREHVRQTVENAAADGEALIKIKDYLTHGSFMGWVQNVLGLDYKTAQRMMQTAILCRQNMTYVQFGPSVVYELAAPSTPEDVRRAVLAGEVAPTVAAVKQAKTAAKAGEPITGASASGAARSQIAKIGEQLGKLLTCADPDDLGDDEVEQLACWLADAYEPGDAADIRARALGWAGVLVEAVEAAKDKPPTENGEEDEA